MKSDLDMSLSPPDGELDCDDDDEFGEDNVVNFSSLLGLI